MTPQMMRAQKKPEPIRQLIVASVMHTGTHFLMWDVLRDFEDWHTAGGRGRGAATGPGYVVFHTDAASMPTLLDSEDPIVCPVRNPYDTCLSWARRGRSMGQLAEQWQNLIGLRDRAAYLPIDTPRRDAFLAALSARLGLELATDWAVQRYDDQVKQSTQAELTPDERQIVGRIVADHHDFFVDCGYAFGG